jgi:hypothetical protein
MRDNSDFVTIPAPDTDTASTRANPREFVIRHEVPFRLITAADIKKGERYKVAFTNKCLGTRWWMFGDLKNDDWKDVKFVQRSAGLDTPEDKEWTNEEGKWYKGEEPDDLALVIEGDDDGAVEIEVV